MCDCPWQSLCEADLLAGLVFEATAPVQHPVVSQAGGPARRVGARRAVILASSAKGATGIPHPITPFPWSQEAVVLAFRKLFLAQWFESVSFPWIEDLLNQPPFTLFPAWLAKQELDWDGPLVPQNASRQGRLLSRHADGQQAGAHSHRAALPPLLSFGLSPDEHFAAALAKAQKPLPFEALPPVDDDLRFVADIYGSSRGCLPAMRKQCMGVLKELKRRWAKVSRVLRHYQTPAIQAVTRQRDLGLVALLILLSSWSDTGYPFGLIKGLPAVGFAPHYGIFPCWKLPRWELTMSWKAGRLTMPGSWLVSSQVRTTLSSYPNLCKTLRKVFVRYLSLAVNSSNLSELYLIGLSLGV